MTPPLPGYASQSTWRQLPPALMLCLPMILVKLPFKAHALLFQCNCERLGAFYSLSKATGETNCAENRPVNTGVWHSPFLSTFTEI